MKISLWEDFLFLQYRKENLPSGTKPANKKQKNNNPFLLYPKQIKHVLAIHVLEYLSIHEGRQHYPSISQCCSNIVNLLCTLQAAVLHAIYWLIDNCSINLAAKTGASRFNYDTDDLRYKTYKIILYVHNVPCITVKCLVHVYIQGDVHPQS